MVAAISTHFDQRSYLAVDAADKESCRPDFAIACYPGHLWNKDKGFVLNPNVSVTSNTPPYSCCMLRMTAWTISNTHWSITLH